MNMATERLEEMTGAEEARLIAYLKKQGWTSEQILNLLEYVRR